VAEWPDYDALLGEGEAMKRLLIGGAAALLLAGPAMADGYTGNSLFADCAASDYSSRNYCLGFTAGISTAMANSGAACPPGGSTFGQDRDIAKKFLADHPEQRHLEAGVLVHRAITEAFPCKVAGR
jgi:Rap1a immunity proteins